VSDVWLYDQQQHRLTLPGRAEIRVSNPSTLMSISIQGAGPDAPSFHFSTLREYGTPEENQKRNEAARKCGEWIDRYARLVGAVDVKTLTPLPDPAE
jgi:hypothetical protein